MRWKPGNRILVLVLAIGTSLASCGVRNQPDVADATTKAAAPLCEAGQDASEAGADANLELEHQTELAVRDLAEQLKVDQSAIAVVESCAVIWPDGAKGCPEPGFAYTQALVPGVLLVLRHDDDTFRYHGPRAGTPIHCPEESAEAPLERENRDPPDSDT
ncbi:hypothetical protein BH24PSE2_BH24PSE2_20560 [soil metagenome]